MKCNVYACVQTLQRAHPMHAYSSSPVYVCLALSSPFRSMCVSPLLCNNKYSTQHNMGCYHKHVTSCTQSVYNYTYFRMYSVRCLKYRYQRMHFEFSNTPRPDFKLVINLCTKVYLSRVDSAVYVVTPNKNGAEPGLRYGDRGIVFPSSENRQSFLLWN